MSTPVATMVRAASQPARRQSALSAAIRPMKAASGAQTAGRSAAPAAMASTRRRIPYWTATAQSAAATTSANTAPNASLRRRT